MNAREKIEEMVRRNPQQSRFTTALTRAELKKLGFPEFEGKFTHQVNMGGLIGSSWRTVEIVPRAGK